MKDIPITTGIIIGIIALVVGLVIGFLIGYIMRKKTAEKKIGSAEAEAERIVSEAVKTGEAKRKEMIVEAKEDILKAKTEADRENKERRHVKRINDLFCVRELVAYINQMKHHH